MDIFLATSCVMSSPQDFPSGQEGVGLPRSRAVMGAVRSGNTGLGGQVETDSSVIPFD